MTGCGKVAVNGSCFPDLAFTTSSTWTSTNVDKLNNWTSTLYIGASPTIFALPPATANPRANVRRKNHIGHTSKELLDDYDGIDPVHLEYKLFWTPHDGSSSSSNNNNPTTTKFAADYVGMPPPTGLVRNAAGKQSDPGGTNVATVTGTITSTPSEPGKYTAWLLLEDKSVSATDQKNRLAEYGLPLDLPAEWNQLVVAQHTFTVVEKPQFKVVSFERLGPAVNGGAPADDSTSDDTTITATNLTKTLDLIVGDVTRIAQLNLDTFKTSGRADSDITFALTGAPDGIFVVETTGEIIAIPQVASDGVVVVGLNAQADDGTIALIQYIFINIKRPATFVLEPISATTRVKSGQKYTTPANKITPYYVDQTYLISRLELNASRTVLTSGSTDASKLKYVLRDAPSSWFVSGSSGEITGNFNTVGVYNFSLVAVDDRGQGKVLEDFTFDVVKKEPFAVLKHSQNISKTRDLEQSDYTDRSTMATYAVGETYRFASIVVEKVDNTDDATSDLSFAVQGAPPGLLIDPADGYIQATPTSPGNFIVTLFAEDSRNERAKITEMTMLIKYKDTDIPANGPNGADCTNGKHVDTVPFDGAFTCNCNSTQYEGFNCELRKPESAATISSPGKDTGPLVGGLLGFVVFCTVVGMIVYRYRAHNEAMKATNFSDELQRMIDAGEIDEDVAGKDLIPREIKRSHITLLQTIGSGQFGEVHKALLDESAAGGPPEYIVAVKTVITAKLTPEATQELASEATVMVQVGAHSNLVSIIGVVTRGMPLMLVVSFCENGSLLGVLRDAASKGPSLTASTKLKMSAEIAKGMAHLASKLFIHRDLAARNVLVSSGSVCKVADFGLSRGTGEVGSPGGNDDDSGGDADESASYYRSSTGVFPVRWTAPESMETMKFTSASDVWSFGVTLAEIYNDGNQPYKGMKNAEVIHKVQGGYRMPQPSGCPAAVYSIIRSCWEGNTSARPQFSALTEALNALVDDPACDPSRVEETNIDGAYLQVASDDYEVPVAGGGTDYRDDAGAGQADNSLATQEASGDDYTAPVALANPEAGSRLSELAITAAAGNEGDHDAGTTFEVLEDNEDNEDAALYELATQECAQDAAPLPAVSATVAAKLPPRPTSIAPTPAVVAAIAKSTTIQSPPTSPPPDGSATLVATAESRKRIAAGSTGGVACRPPPLPPMPVATKQLSTSNSAGKVEALPRSTARQGTAAAAAAALSSPASTPAVAARRPSTSTSPTKKIPVPVPTRRVSASGQGAPTPTRRPSSIVASAISDFGAPPTVANPAISAAPKPRPRSVARNLSDAMSGDEVWAMAADAEKLAAGLMPAVQASKLLKKTALSNDSLKEIWNVSKSAIAGVPSNAMSKAEFVKAYELALVAGGQPIRSISLV